MNRLSTSRLRWIVLLTLWTSTLILPAQGEETSPSQHWSEAWSEYLALPESIPDFVRTSAAQDLAHHLAGLSDDDFEEALEIVTAESLQNPQARHRLRLFLHRDLLGENGSVSPALLRLRERLNRDSQEDLDSFGNQFLIGFLDHADLMFWLTYGARGVWGLARAWSVLPQVEAPRGGRLATAFHKGRFVVNSLFRFGRYEALTDRMLVTYERASPAHFPGSHFPGTILFNAKAIPVSSPETQALRPAQKALVPKSATSPEGHSLAPGASCEVLLSSEGMTTLGRGSEVIPQYDFVFVRPRSTGRATLATWLGAGAAASLVQTWINSSRSRLPDPRQRLQFLETDILLPRLLDIADADVDWLTRLESCVSRHFSETEIFEARLGQSLKNDSDCGAMLRPLYFNVDAFLAFFDHYAGIKSRLLSLQANSADLSRAGFTQTQDLALAAALRAAVVRISHLTSPLRLDGFVRALKVLVHAEALKSRGLNLPDVSDIGEIGTLRHSR